METGHVPGKNRPYIIEFVGVSGVGKSFLFQKLKERLAENSDCLFVEKSAYNRFQLIYPCVFLSTVITMIRCNIDTRQHLYKHIKMFYFTQVLLKKGLKSGAKIIFIDEGPLHRVRAIKIHSNKSEDTVRKLILNKKIIMTDIVLFLEASPENIYLWRQKRGTRGADTPIEQLQNNKGDSLARTYKDIQYAQEYVKSILFLKIINNNDDLPILLDDIFNKIQNLTG